MFLTEMNKNSVVSMFESYFLSVSVHIFRNWIVQYLNNKSTITILLEKEKTISFVTKKLLFHMSANLKMFLTKMNNKSGNSFCFYFWKLFSVIWCFRNLKSISLVWDRNTITFEQRKLAFQIQTILYISKLWPKITKIEKALYISES